MVCAVKKAFLLLARWAYIMAVTFSVGYLTVHFGRRTAWYKDHLYQQLVRGDAGGVEAPARWPWWAASGNFWRG